MGEERVDLPGYVKKPDDCNIKPTPNTVDCARRSVQTLADKYDNEKRILEATHNGGVLSLFGLGTAAGINAIQKGSKNQLQRLGIAAGGVVGFDDAFGVDGQHVIYDSGVTALDCVMRTDVALDVATESSKKNDNAGANAEMLMANQNTDALSVLNLPRTSATFSDLDKIMAIQAIGDVSEAIKTNDVLNSELTLATLPDVRSMGLIAARDDINKAVEVALYKNADPSKIFDAMKSGLQKFAGGAAGAAQANQSAAAKAASKSVILENLQTAAAMDVMSAKNRRTARNADAFNSVTSMEYNLLKAANGNAGATQPLTDTYQACIALAAPSPKPAPVPDGKNP